MYVFISILILIASILLILIVLIQNSKGGGLASGFSSSNQIMGVRKTTDFIEKLTWGLAGFMVVISVACAYVIPQATSESSVVKEQALKESTTNPLNAPAGFAAPTTAPAEEAQPASDETAQ